MHVGWRWRPGIGPAALDATGNPLRLRSCGCGCGEHGNCDRHRAYLLAVFAGLLFAGRPADSARVSQSPTSALWVMLVFTALHIVEGYVLTPLLARTAMRFPPASTLASQAVFSALLGPIGLTFATPLMIVGVTSVQEWRKQE